MTEDWTGHTVTVTIKTAKTSGNPYLSFIPTDEPKIDLEEKRVEQFRKDVKEQQEKNEEAGNGKVIEYPKEEIDPNDIPF